MANYGTFQYNNTLAPYKTCPNAGDRTKSDRAIPYIKEWASIYLKDAHARLQPQLKGYDLSIEDIYIFQQVCNQYTSSQSCFLSGFLSSYVLMK